MTHLVYWLDSILTVKKQTRIVMVAAKLQRAGFNYAA